MERSHKNINNLSGNIQGSDVKLQASNDINNLGGRIAAENSLIVQAASDINIASTTQSSANAMGASRFTRTGTLPSWQLARSIS